MSSVWDYCVFDASTSLLIQNLENFAKSSDKSVVLASSVDATSSSGGAKSLPAENDWDIRTSSNGAADDSGIDGLQESLVSSENSCRSFMGELDSLLHTLGEVAALHDDVTSRTNSLMFNCENLLEQQHTLQATVDVLKSTLAPFNDVEGVAGLLGIPFDARGLPTRNWDKGSERGSIKGDNTSVKGVITDTFNIDPRAPEFKDVLVRLSTALKSLKGVNFLDSERYHRWLVQLQCRAASLVARAMRDLLEGASGGCAAQKKSGGGSDASGRGDSLSRRNNGPETPLESTPIYAKFRGLGFRMRELSALLKIATPDEEHSSGNMHGSSRMVGNGMYQSSSAPSGDLFLRSEQDVMCEVKLNYVILRTQLLLPFVLESCTVTGPGTPPLSGAATPTHSQALIPPVPPLCPTIRHAYSTLLRVAQMEVQLFDSLFRPPDCEDPNAPLNPKQPVKASGTSGEVVSIIESICNATGDFLRPLIIRENNVDELCRVVNTLSEDIKAQIDGLFPLFAPSSSPPSSSFSTAQYQRKNESLEGSRNLLRTLNRGLDKTVSDAQERLSYCSEIKMRVEVQFFDPLPSQLAYPGIIERHEEKRAERVKARADKRKLKRDENGNWDNEAERHEEMDDISATWYPPLLHTLSLLSKLYGCLEIKIFEHFASQLIFFCLNSLKKGSEKIKQNGGRTGGVGGSVPGSAVNWGDINGDLFLIRHLLILREQLIPFNIKLQKMNLNLDFLPSKKALNSFLVNNVKSIVNFNNSSANTDNNTDTPGYSPNSASSSSSSNNSSNSYFYNNSFLLLAREGLPNIVEKEVLIKKDLDLDLKNACQALKDSVLKKILSGVDSFLAKIQAFVGDFTSPSTPSTLANPAGYTANTGRLPPLPQESRDSLKKQDFMKIERVKEMLGNVQETVVLTAPEFMASMKLYVENNVARAIILRPLLQEISTVHRKMECVISSCYDPGSPTRELEQLLLSIVTNVTAELSY